MLERRRRRPSFIATECRRRITNVREQRAKDMAKQKREQTKRPQANAGKNSGSEARKRSERQPKAAGKGASSKPAPPKAPAGQSSEPTHVVKQSEKKGGLFKFRRYKKVEGGKGKKARHPKLIVEQEKDMVGFMGLTEEPKSGHHNNIPLTKNPKKRDKRKAYLRKELRRDKLDNFGEILEDYGR